MITVGILYVLYLKLPTVIPIALHNTFTPELKNERWGMIRIIFTSWYHRNLIFMYNVEFCTTKVIIFCLLKTKPKTVYVHKRILTELQRFVQMTIGGDAVQKPLRL